MARRGYVSRSRNLKDQVKSNAAILRALIPADRPMPPPVASLAYLDAPKRVYTKSKESFDSEKSVLKRVRAALRKHPSVAFCWREQSGVFTEGNRTVTVGFKGKPDLIGMLRDGRFYAIECKNSDGGEQSAEQAYFLSLVRSAGGLAGFASSVEEAIKIIS